ncbi:hypothetical protein BKA67DRAFT_555542 [Truncatella angustata]|uniref:Uncharacterized protein n=1 Tax=Truncatella angustata TaxID=152316 RepID=A0A9P9A0X6_9PEZI|nr:uncharacterized protein BKA67DRAFT_555542 [Truncatella angustata]KAH6657529.1 hypothetical protein BKA67DRAFT_555542 [Truncatella angustata]
MTSSHLTYPARHHQVSELFSWIVPFCFVFLLFLAQFSSSWVIRERGKAVGCSLALRVVGLKEYTLDKMCENIYSLSRTMRGIQFKMA